MCPGGVDPLVSLESDPGQGVEAVPPPLADLEIGTTPRDTDSGCPGTDTSHANGSGLAGHDLEGSPRELRSKEELERLMQEAAAMWE